jgi:hypothetical protein
MRIETTAQVQADGTLDLHLETGLAPREVRVFVWIEPELPLQTPVNQGWPPGYFETFYGALADETWDEPEELPFEVRSEWN